MGEVYRLLDGLAGGRHPDVDLLHPSQPIPATRHVPGKKSQQK